MSKPSSVSEEVKQDIATCREEGVTLDRIAKRFGLSRHHVDRVCLEMGAYPEVGKLGSGARLGQRNGIYVRNGREVRTFTREEDELMLKLSAQGMNKYQIAKRLGRTSNTVTQRFRALARHEAAREAGHELPEPPLEGV